MRSILVLSCLAILGCGTNSDAPTGSADLEAGASRVAYSAWTEWNPSYTVDTNQALRGWAIFFSRAEPGLDCRQLELDASQTVYIATQQPATGQLANVPTGTIPLTMTATAISGYPNATIALDWQDMQSFTGSITITRFDATGTTGTLTGTAVPFDQTAGATLAVTGMFDARACGGLAY